jgi:hypothetical protein
MRPKYIDKWKFRAGFGRKLLYDYITSSMIKFETDNMMHLWCVANISIGYKELIENEA